MLSSVYVTVGCPSIFLSCHSIEQWWSAGLLLSALLAGYRSTVTGAQQHGVQQQMRAVSCWQPRYDDFSYWNPMPKIHCFELVWYSKSWYISHTCFCTWKFHHLYLVKCRIHASVQTCFTSKNGWFLNSCLSHGTFNSRQATLRSVYFWCR